MGMSKEKRLVIMRGLPGSGKSFRAEEIYEEYINSVICSTDVFWFNEAGDYVFDGSKLGEAHAWNRGRAAMAMELGVDLVIIDNTNTQAKEYQPYIDMGEEQGYNVEFAMPTTPWAWDVDECAKRNSHSVPREAIQRMYDRFEGRPE